MTCGHCEIFGVPPNVKWNKSSHARRHFTLRSNISRAKRISQIPKGIYFVEKTPFVVRQRVFFWRRRRDLNPRGHFWPYALSRGASSTSWVLLQSKVFYTWFSCSSWFGEELAERVGFEPTAPFGVTSFQDWLLKPLGHLSVSLTAWVILPDSDAFVNCFFKKIFCGGVSLRFLSVYWQICAYCV